MIRYVIHKTLFAASVELAGGTAPNINVSNKWHRSAFLN